MRKPIKTGLLGYIHYHGPRIARGESKAATRLAQAIESCNAEGIRNAVSAGASLEDVEGTSGLPLELALYKCNRPGGKECVEVLLELGCPIDGRPQDTPPIVGCTALFLNDDLALAIAELLLTHGANANAVGPHHGVTAIFDAAIHKRTALVRILMQHGADPSIPFQNQLIIERLKAELVRSTRPREQAEYAEILSLLTGEEVLPPPVAPLPPALQSENAYFARCEKAEGVLRLLSSEMTLGKLMKLPIENKDPFPLWQQELLDAGFEPAGDYSRKFIFDMRNLRAFVHPGLRSIRHSANS